MEFTTTLGNSAFAVVGLILLVFNGKIGRFAKKHGEMDFGLKLLAMWPWFPRLNTVLVGAFLAFIGISGLYEQFMTK